MKQQLALTKFAVPALASLLALAAGCSHLGSSRIETVERPDHVTDFKTLYSQNCAGCHGANGQNGASIDLANPVYQAWVQDATLQRIIAMGEPPTEMPAFAQSSGGMLTDAQVDALVKGMRTAWPANGALNGQTPPPAQPAIHGDAAQGEKTYQVACLRCHSQPNQKVTDPTYLALINNRTLRTIIVAGRPDLGHPDWRDDIPGRALTAQEVEDIVAYLNSLRSDTPGQPYTPQERGQNP
jgi:cytochrome c oxidase cbb3-type subunit 3/ubiquinol-cytochrome c reductase cytochrome c subunit